jgi:hypothetical protein
MTYSKPEVLEMGEAVQVIQGGKPSSTIKEPFPKQLQPRLVNAYDLDD